MLTPIYIICTDEILNTCGVAWISGSRLTKCEHPYRRASKVRLDGYTRNRCKGTAQGVPYCHDRIRIELLYLGPDSVKNLPDNAVIGVDKSLVYFYTVRESRIQPGRNERDEKDVDVCEKISSVKEELPEPRYTPVSASCICSLPANATMISFFTSSRATNPCVCVRLLTICESKIGDSVVRRSFIELHTLPTSVPLTGLGQSGTTRFSTADAYFV